MNVQTAMMDVPWDVAQAAYRNYRQAIKASRATKDDVALSRAYHALMRGKKLIDVALAVEAGGVFERTGLPKIAIARADWTTLFCVAEDGNTRYRFSSRQFNWGRPPRGEVPTKVPVPLNAQANVRGRAQVPLIPPQFRREGFAQRVSHPLRGGLGDTSTNRPDAAEAHRPEQPLRRARRMGSHPCRAGRAPTETMSAAPCG